MSTDDNEFRPVTWAGDQFQLSDDDDANGMPLRPPRGPGLSDADLELLRLAARVLGAVRVEEVEGEQWVNLYFADGSTMWNWNPLLHGDDTFNLAADLGLQVFPAARTASGSACSAVGDPCGRRLSEVTEVAGVRAATRLAVTSAAAELGRSLQNGNR